ncbi:MAG: hypothetical protein ABSC47_11770, partial [Terracidiphilus sp.]
AVFGLARPLHTAPAGGRAAALHKDLRISDRIGGFGVAASIFHFGVSSARSLKEELAKAGVSVRLPC